MLTQKQLEERKNYLGASDSAGVLGISRWSSPLKVWGEKTGEIPREDIGDKLYVKLGHLLEDDMTELFEEQTGKKLHRVNDTQYHKEHSFIAANIDRRIVGENVPVELKTANAFKSKEWQGEQIPREYIIQCMHTLAVTGRPHMWLGVLIGSQDFQIKQIMRDEALIAEIVTREVAFWRGFVIPRIMPRTVTKYDGETLDNLYPEAVAAKTIRLSDEASVLIEILDGYEQDVKNLEGLIEQSKNQLKMLLGDAEHGETATGAFCSWKNQSRNALDQKLLKAEMPDIHARYTKPSMSRRFSYDIKKGE